MRNRPPRVGISAESSRPYGRGHAQLSPFHAGPVLPVEIWLYRAGEPGGSLMKAIADVVFVKPRPRWPSSVSKDALNFRARDFRPTQEPDDYEQEASKTTWMPRKLVNLPTRLRDQRPNASETSRPTANSFGRRATWRSAGSARTRVIPEDVQRRQLKLNQYASHCQIERTRQSLGTLALAGSHAESAGNRTLMLQAHHSDKIPAHGTPSYIV